MEVNKAKEYIENSFLKELIDNPNITDISYTNGGQVWLKTLDKGVYQVNRPEINNALMEKQKLVHLQKILHYVL